MQLTFDSPENFLLLLLIPVFGILFQIHRYRRKKLISGLLRGDFPRSKLYFYSSRKDLFKFIFFVCGFFFLVIVLARPQGISEKTEVAAPVRDTFFILDISGSMLARDIVPNRLEHAKKLILEMIKGIDSSRIALILFSGRSKVSVPLTFDYEFFKKKLQEISPDEILIGGTAISSALSLLNSITDVEGGKERSVNAVLITDGEEQEKKSLEVARELGEKKISVDTIGIGETSGAKIPAPNSPDGFLTYQGKEVVSKLDEKTLKSIAEITGGIYIPAKRAQIDIQSIYKKYILPREKGKKANKEVRVAREFYQFFLLFGIILLLTDHIIREYKN